jgi:hypothetical protein
MTRNVSRLVEVLLDRAKFTRDEAIAIAIASTVFAVVFCHPLISHLLTPGAFNDWDMVLGTQWAAYWTVRQYHQFPQWNPFECGGVPLLGDPSSHFLTPWFPLTLMFRPAVALHLEVVFNCAIGWAGGYMLGRVLVMRRISAACTATAFAGSSWFFLHATEGHFVFVAMVYLPWIIAAAWAASERGKLRYAAFSGAFMALSFFEGGPYPVLYEGLALALVIAGRAGVGLSIRPLIALGLVALFAAGFGAVKIAPVIQVMASHPRPTDESWINTLDALHQALLSRNQDRARPSLNGWGFWELGAYVGLFAVIAVAGLRYPRRAMPWIFAAIILFQLARGWTGPNSLWVWLHRMPVFSSTRLPSRHLIPFVLMVAVLAGLGIDVVCNRGSPVALAISALLIVIGGVDMLLVGPPNLRNVSLGVVDPGPPRNDFAQYMRATALAQASVLQHHEGVVNCYMFAPWPTVAKGWNEPGYRGEQYLLGAGTVTLTRWTPNRLEYAVDAPAASVMVVNQNYDPSWRVTSGTGPAFSQDGLLAVRVPAGKSHVDLRYTSRAVLYGFAITLLTAIGAIVLFRLERRIARS